MRLGIRWISGIAFIVTIFLSSLTLAESDNGKPTHVIQFNTRFFVFDAPSKGASAKRVNGTDFSTPIPISEIDKTGNLYRIDGVGWVRKIDVKTNAKRKPALGIVTCPNQKTPTSKGTRGLSSTPCN